MASDNVRVAVRVRPFNEREKKRGAVRVTTMEGTTTHLHNPANPKEKPHTFNFDYSYWSHDGYKVNKEGYSEPENPKYIDQVKVFNDLGKGMLLNAWSGYNSTIFAYGQTGSGKSYSIMGHGANKGLVPRTCEELFLELEKRAKSEAGVQFAVEFSMLEVYKEEVRDLLNKKKTPPGGLKVRENQSKGFYVEGLSIVPVGSYNDVRLRMNEGDRQRTIAATKMNETSSRAHTIVCLVLKQNQIKTKTTKHATINLVDLAGSERANQTGATGDRFEEAKKINQSLSTLGNVIKGLCDKAKGSPNAIIPVRDSVLTKLLKNALGGNSKTIMMAAISPDAENYDQTLSTLRYADRAKSIRNSAQVNQTATDKMIKELIQEKERLLRELQSAKATPRSGISEEEIDRMKKEQQQEIDRYKEEITDVEKSWQKRLEEARKEMEDMMRKEERAKEEERKIPHFSNLNEDPALEGKLHHLIRQGNSRIGNGKEGSSPEMRLNGPRIAKEHSVVSNQKGEVILKPLNGSVLYNGKELTENTPLHHQDRVRFGSNNLFVFNHPGEAAALKKKGRQLMEITYEYAQNEIAKHSGLNIEDEDLVLQEEVMSIMQLVSDVNAMAEDMEKPAEFNIVLVSAEARGLDSGRTEVFVKVHDTENDNEYLWDRNKFLNRQVHMQEMYQNYEETENLPEVEKDKDPFWEPPETPVIVGVVSVPLNYLSHMVEFMDEPLTVIDYKARQIGFLQVDIIPCDSKGNEDVDLVVDDPIDLVGRNMAFKLKIHNGVNLPERYVKTWCKYRFYNEGDFTKTKQADGQNPKYELVRVYKLSKSEVDHKFVEYLREKCLAIEIWGEQGERGGITAAGKGRRVEKQKLQDEVHHWHSKAERLQEKMDRIRGIVEKGGRSAELQKIKKILDE